MAEQSDQHRPDIMEIWREWLTQSERQFNSFFNQAMNTESIARSVGGYMEVNAAFQRMTAEAMQRYLTFMNMPSRADVLGLGDALRNIEDRLARIEEMFQVAAEAAGPIDGRVSPASEPTRTRRPPGVPAAAEQPVADDVAEISAVPEQLRR